MRTSLPDEIVNAGSVGIWLVLPVLEHDPEKWTPVLGKIMLLQEDRS